MFSCPDSPYNIAFCVEVFPKPQQEDICIQSLKVLAGDGACEFMYIGVLRVSQIINNKTDTPQRV